MTALTAPHPESAGPPPNLGRWLAAAGEVLAAAGVESARLDARLIAAHGLGWDQARVLARPEHALGDAATRRLDALLAKRAARRPLAHVLGYREFWSLAIRVSADTLVPRPESETVVSAALAPIEDRARPISILDLGTGSGCLMLALLTELPNATALGVDVSEPALRIAAENARALGLGARASFLAADWGLGVAGAFDLIVANPPYVAETDRDALMPEVRAWEPQGALFAGADGLAAIRRLAPDAARLLTPAGRVLIEIGPGQGAEATAQLARAGLGTARIHADLAGRQRVIEAQHASDISAPNSEKKVGNQ